MLPFQKCLFLIGNKNTVSVSVFEEIKIYRSSASKPRNWVFNFLNWKKQTLPMIKTAWRHKYARSQAAAWQTLTGMRLHCSLRQPVWLPGSTSNTNNILEELASSCKAVGFYEIKAFWWRTVPAEIDVVYCSNKLSA